MEGCTRSLESKRIEWDECRNMQMWNREVEMKLSTFSSLLLFSEGGEKEPKNVWWKVW